VISYSLLGPVLVRDGERDLTPGPAKHRALLAALALAAGQVATVERLVAVVWGSEPPRSAESVLRVYVSALRRLLGPGAIRTVPGGYLLDAVPEQVDVRRFEAMLADARHSAAAGRTTEASGRLREALALWRDEPMADLDSDELRRGAAVRLAELRLAAQDERIELDLALGRHREVTGELRRLVAEFPLREQAWAQLLLALHRSGRRSEALDAYQQARRVLVDQLGLEPGTQLRAMHEQVLADDPSLGLGQPPPSPRETPPDVADFTGRQPALAWITGAVVTVDTPVHLVLYGPAGVGKSAVAIRAARLLADRFPDGQLYANLRGAQGPLPPATVLENLLRSLGGPRIAAPEDLDGRVRLFRTLLGGRRTLVLLDDAADEAQVRPLLAASPGCATLVTSRSGLAGLEAAAAYHLDTLPGTEAVALLGTLVGQERVAAEPAAAGRIAQLCGGLPLALRIAGARLARREGWTLGHLAGRLADERRRLDELSAGDLAVRGSLALGYQELAEPEQRLFRRLGALGAPDVAAWAVAALLGEAEAAAERLVEGLVEAGLLQELGVDAAGQQRYRFHDLTRLYARELAEPQWTPLARRVLELARRARTLLLPREPGSGETTRIGEPTTLRVGTREIRESADWLAAERGFLVATVVDLHRAGLAEPAWRLAFYLAPFFESRAHLDDWRRTHEQALASARAAGHDRGVALVLRGIGDLHRLEGRLPEAAAALRESLALLGDGDRVEEARSRYRLGWVELAGDELAAAEACFEAALETFGRFRDARGTADALRGLGVVHRRRGRLKEAADCLSASASGFRELGDPRGEAEALRERGLAQLALGDRGPARDSIERALANLRRLAERLAEAHALVALARVDLAEGVVDAARGAAEQAREVCREYGDHPGEAEADTVLAVIAGYR
jgi:DNA-binding SARP family transcriptional activator